MAIFLLALMFIAFSTICVCETIATVRASRLEGEAFDLEWSFDAPAHVALVSTIDFAMALSACVEADRAKERAALAAKIDAAIAVSNMRAAKLERARVRAARIEAVRAFVPNIARAASALLMAARKAIRWTVAESVTLRALRRVLRVTFTREVAAASLGIVIVLGSVAATIRSGLATRSAARASVKALRPTLAARSGKPRAFRGMTCKGRKNARGYVCVRAEVR